MKISIGKTVCILAGLVLLSGGAAAWIFLNPEASAAAGNILCPDRMIPVDAVLNQRSFRMKAYFKRRGGLLPDGSAAPAVLLCNLPLSPSSGHSPHLKLFRDRIGVFQTPADWFQVSPRYVLLREGSLLSVPLEDDMKGWDCEYTIREDRNRIRYEIFPNPPRQPDHIILTIELKDMQNMPKNSSGPQKDIRFRPYRQSR